MVARRAATLIELMVVGSILASTAALLLPAIQQARETSRANVCRNNLKQIGMSILNFESQHRHFPKGAEGRFDRSLSPTRMIGLSWWVDVLAGLEQSAVADQVDRRGANTGWAYLNSHNGELVNGFAPDFWFCPSSPVERFVKSGDFLIAAPVYSGISGASSHDGFYEPRVSRCCRSEGEISAGGVLVPNAVIRINQVIDGLSKTLLVAEQSDHAFTESGQPQRIAASFLLGWMAGTDALGVPPNYGSWLSPTYNLTTIRYPLNERRYDLPGVYNDLGANNPLLSAHPGIVNVAYCDGSVFTLADTLDVRVLKSLATRDDELSNAR